MHPILRMAALIMLVATPALAAEYETEVYIPGYGFHGIHGLAVDGDGQIFVGSVVGQAIYQVDAQSGESSVWAPGPTGMADDIEIGPNGQFYWTSFTLGKVHTRLEDGTVKELATGLPGINSLAMNADGRLFATQVFLGDALHEIDPKGEKPARKIMENMGGLNGFDFGPDGRLYGPLWFKGQVVAVDVDTAEIEVIADGFTVPAAVNWNSKGELFAVDSARGEVIQINPATGDKSVRATVNTGIDNLAFDPEDNLYLTVMTENAIYQINDDGSARTVKEAQLGMPADIEILGNTLIIADTFSNRAINLETGDNETVVRFPEDPHEYSNGIAITDTHIHSASFFNSAVQTIDRATGEITHTYHGLVTPFDVLELPDGRLITNQLMAGNIVHIAGENEYTPLVTGLRAPVALARADADRVYVTEYGAGAVTLADLGSGTRTTVAEGLEGPEGIAVGPGGYVYVVETGAKRVTKIDPATRKKTVIAEDLPVGYQTPPGLPPMGVTSGIAVADNGDVYISSDIESAIYRIRKVN